ncbi:MAG: Rpn family recombination-promoting nuclease/putative transposase [Eubacterium sp.]|nr:Rpn family recombination-promoting nuclease/putative transposase [Eubacterium sp.]
MEKDITQKTLEDYKDVFADIINGFVFEGKQVVTPRQLVNSRTKSQYKADDSKIHEQERDNSKFWKKEQMLISVFGIENQIVSEKNMPIRIIGYDGASYRSQILGKPPFSYYPVVTIVLYFGMTHWNYSKHLINLFDIPEEMKIYVNDYKINVFEVAFLTPEQVNMFKSDFREVADFFVQKRTKKKYVPSKRKLKHVDEVLKLLEVMTGDDRFKEVMIPEDRKKDTTMCEIVDSFVRKGISQGISLGVEQDIRSIKNLVDSGDVPADIAKIIIAKLSESRK